MTLAGTLVVTNVTFWGVNALFMFMDITNKPFFLTKYKVQEDKNVPVSEKRIQQRTFCFEFPFHPKYSTFGITHVTFQMDMDKFWNAVRTVVCNSTLGGAVMLLLFYPIALWRGCEYGRELPTLHRAIFEIVVFAAVEEIGFYYTHR